MNDAKFAKWLVAVNAAVPLTLLLWDAWHRQLGANAVNFAIRTTGILALLFLMLTLAVTPLRRWTGWNILIAARRPLGLAAFTYALLHLGIYVGFDRAMDMSSALKEIVARRYLQVGIIAIMLMVPLAITSTDAMIRRIGAKKWKQLHRLTYVVAIAGTLHFFLLVKADLRVPMVYAVVLTALLVARLSPDGNAKSQSQNSLRGRDSRSPERSPMWSGQMRIEQIIEESPDVKTFRLVPTSNVNRPFSFMPGQYLNFEFNIDGHRVKRSYSISSSPAQLDFCDITVRRIDSGIASTYLHSDVTPGVFLNVSGPAGKFVFTGDHDHGVVFIAGGVGITPFISMVRSLASRGWMGEVHLVVVARTAIDLLFHDELIGLKNELPNLRLHFTLTRETSDSKWTGHRGRLTAEKLAEMVPNLSAFPVYLCGPTEMMACTKSILQELGVDTKRIKTETFASPKATSSNRAGQPQAQQTQAQQTQAGRIPIERFDTATEADSIRLTFAESGKTATSSTGRTILEIAEEHGVDLPFECRAGICGQCKVRVSSGDVLMDADDALSESERDSGWVLACQARCLTDVTASA